MSRNLHSQRPITPVNSQFLNDALESYGEFFYLLNEEKIVKITKAHAFILANGNFALKTEEKPASENGNTLSAAFYFTGFSLLNREELEKKFQEFFGDAPPEDEMSDFSNAVKYALHLLNHVLEDISLLEGINEDSTIKIHRAREKKTGGDDKILFTHNPNRSMIYRNFEEGLLLDNFHMIKCMMINADMQKMLQMNNLAQDRYRVLPMRSHEGKANARIPYQDPGLFLRDNLLEVDATIFQTKMHQQDFTRQDVNTKKESGEESLADGLAEGILPKNIATIPFSIEGGSVIFCEEKKLYLITLSEIVIDANGQFLGGSFGDQDFSPAQYQEYCTQIKNWFQERGYDSIIVERNIIENDDDHSFDALYHGDVFMACVGDLLIIDPTSVKPERLAELTARFGEKNVFHISVEERDALTTNLITINDNLVVFSNPNAPPRLIEELTKRGYDCGEMQFTTSCSRSKTDGIRCHTVPISQRALELVANQEAQVIAAENIIPSSATSSQGQAAAAVKGFGKIRVSEV